MTLENALDVGGLEVEFLGPLNMLADDLCQLIWRAARDGIDHVKVLADGYFAQFFAGESPGADGVGGEGIMQDGVGQLLIARRAIQHFVKIIIE